MTTTINESTSQEVSTQPLVTTEQSSTNIRSLKFDYYSATKFVKFIDEAFKNSILPVKPKRNETISSAQIWFKGSDTFTGKFDNYCVKYPVYMRLITSIERNIKLDYQQLATIMKVKPILSFSQNWDRSVPKGNQRKNIYKLVIGFYPEQSKDGFPYQPTTVYAEKIQSILSTINKLTNSEAWQAWTVKHENDNENEVKA